MIDPQLQAELRAKFNPDGSKLRQLQLRQLEILKYVDEFCKKNEIKYWLSSGTCLGAVRHGGFIPWDDDIDIEMLRPDYMKFLKLWQNTAKYTIQNRHTERFFLYSFSKIRENNTIFKEEGISQLFKSQGIFIDIFCMEPFLKFPAQVGDFFIRRICKVLEVDNPGAARKIVFQIEKKILYMLGEILRFLTPINIRRGNCVRHAFGSSNAVNNRYLSEIFPLSHIQFEECTFPIPGDVNAYLTHLFGDFMTIPDINSKQFHTHALNFSFNNQE